jgi:hypothetical protein
MNDLSCYQAKEQGTLPVNKVWTSITYRALLAGGA